MNNSISRRNFIKATGLVGASLAVPPIRSTMASSQILSAHNRVKVGVLLPVSKIYPNMGQHLIDGLNFHFLQQGLQVELVIEPVGSVTSNLQQQVRQLIQQQGVQLLVGILSPQIAASLRDVLHENQTFLLLADVGVSLPTTQNGFNPYVIYNSLNAWQGSWALGGWAFENLGSRAFIASSFYESGFDTVRAFRTRFEQMGGETTLVVSDSPTAPIPFPELMSAIRQANPDFIYAAYSGEDAIAFWQAYAGLNIPVIGSSFMVTEDVLYAVGSLAAGFKTVQPWSDISDFDVQYTEVAGYSPDAFAVLGYETAQLIAHAMQSVNGQMNWLPQLGHTLTTATFQSLRGQIQINPASQTTVTPLYVSEVQANLRLATLATIEPINEMAAATQLSQTRFQSGWINTYLCV